MMQDDISYRCSHLDVILTDFHWARCTAVSLATAAGVGHGGVVLLFHCTCTWLQDRGYCLGAPVSEHVQRACSHVHRARGTTG